MLILRIAPLLLLLAVSGCTTMDFVTSQGAPPPALVDQAKRGECVAHNVKPEDCANWIAQRQAALDRSHYQQYK